MCLLESTLSILYQFLIRFFSLRSSVAYVSFKWKISTFHTVYFPWKTDLLWLFMKCLVLPCFFFSRRQVANSIRIPKNIYVYKCIYVFRFNYNILVYFLDSMIWNGENVTRQQPLIQLIHIRMWKVFTVWYVYKMSSFLSILASTKTHKTSL